MYNHGMAQQTAVIPDRPLGRRGWPEATRLAVLVDATDPALTLAEIAAKHKLPDGTVRYWVAAEKRKQRAQESPA